MVEEKEYCINVKFLKLVIDCGYVREYFFYIRKGTLKYLVLKDYNVCH